MEKNVILCPNPDRDHEHEGAQRRPISLLQDALDFRRWSVLPFQREAQGAEPSATCEPPSRCCQEI